MKVIKWIWDNILFLVTLFLLAFIPLYPKLPLLDVRGTWVYVRFEDFVIVFVILIWIILLILKKITLKTPLTFPIIVFWIIGGTSVLHGVLLIFPTLSDVFPNVAFLSFLRRIEYLFLFFVAFSSIRSKKLIYYVIALLAVVLILVVGYGVGQKFLGFPAYLTSNEEFAKGVAIKLSQLSRVPSTFAGHYDLAAYLVLVIPILTASFFAFRNFFIKTSLFVAVVLGVGLLFMTVSRISVASLFLSMIILLIFQKRRLGTAFLAIIILLFLSFSPSLLERFGNTISEADVLVDAKTGHAIGNTTEVGHGYFENKLVLRDLSHEKDPKLATSSALVPLSNIPDRVILLTEPNEPSGESLPQGTAYINLELSPVTKKINQYFYKKADDATTKPVTIYMLYGDFVIKRAKTYDLSFTTRFQGEWPKTFAAFKRNIFLGSGYGSVTLAADNNYLRILGESGILGLTAFFSIFVVAAIYIKKILPSVGSRIARGFVLGFVAGTFGLFLNALLIDVFEASKVAFTYWLLMGITLGSLSLYKKDEINLFGEFKKVIGSVCAVIIYLFIAVVAVFSGISSNFLVGDDFTWFRWVSNCCNSLSGVVGFFTDADGFFYRPGSKLYFYLMHSAFWLNQIVYHLVSVLLHFAASVLIFIISQRVFKNYFLAAATSFIFIILSGHHEPIFWISATGFLFNAVFALLSLLFFIYWKEKKKSIFLVISVSSIFFALLFHELGVIIPLLLILYDSIFYDKFKLRNFLKKSYNYIFVLPVIPYLILRFLANSHWFSGDYSYNILRLPFNFIGNFIGYLGLSLVGPSVLPIYSTIRSFSREHLMLMIVVSLAIVFVGIFLYKKIIKILVKEDIKIVVFGFLFFIIALLPFLGLGDMTSRYSYLASVGFAILFVFLIKKIYDYILDDNGFLIASSIVGLFVIVFTSVQLFQLQKINEDWHEAGQKSKRFIVSLEEAYISEWRNESLKFYFVNVPIRHGEAWVFPVGLQDAVWLIFGNDKIDVYQSSSLIEALDFVTNPIKEKVFEFGNSGQVVERKKKQE